MRSPGDVVGDCPSCGLADGVRFRGIDNKTGSSEAVCEGCSEVFEIEEDDEQEDTSSPTPAPPPPAAPPPAAPPPAPAPKPKPQADVGSLTPVSSVRDTKASMRLSKEDVDDFTDGGADIPSYIRNSRAWRWAHRMGNTGNPYREGTKNHNVFNLYVKEPRTIEECVLACADLGYNDKLSYLLTVYEVTVHCLSAGLLVIDPESRKISVCQGKPQPVKVT